MKVVILGGGRRRLRAGGSRGLGAALRQQAGAGLAYPPTTAQDFAAFSEAVIRSDRITRMLAS